MIRLTAAEVAEIVGVSDRIVRVRAKDWTFGVKREKGKGLCYPLDALLAADLPKGWVEALSTTVDSEAVTVVEPLSADAPMVAAAVKDAEATDTVEPELMAPESVASVMVVGDDHFGDGNKMVEISPSPSLEGGGLEMDDDLRLNARYEILKLWAKSVEACKGAGNQAVYCDEQFVQGVRSGTIAIPDWVRKGISANNGKIKLNRATLHQWRNAAAAGAAALRPRFRGREGLGFFDRNPEYGTVAECLCREFGTSATVLHYAFSSGLVREEFGLEDVPTEGQISAWLRQRTANNKQRSRAFATGDKSVLLSAQGSYSRGLKPNDKWEIDSTKADATAKKENVVWLQSRFGEAPVRCALVACIDVATRMIKILVRPTSNGEAIANLIAECIRDWGLPKVVKTDNGKDYIGKHVAGFCRAMGIEQKLCVVKQPWEKPHIERLMRSLQHSPAWEMLPWNTGHNVAQQQAYRKRREGEMVLGWTIEDFQAWIDRWVDAYHNSLHDGLGCSPNERLAGFRAEGFVALMPKNLEKNLEFALLLEDLATVNKQGIRYQGRFYVAPELITAVGQQVAIRFNPENPNQIYVYDSKDLTVAKLICVATWDMALSPEEQAKIASTKPVVAEALKRHEDEVKKARRNLKSAIAKNPERLLPERGGVAAIRATEQIETASSALVSAIEAVANQPVVNTDAPEMQDKRAKWLEMQAKQDQFKRTEEVRDGHYWRKLWESEARSREDVEWLLQTIDIPGFGGFVALLEGLPLDHYREVLTKELASWAA